MTFGCVLLCIHCGEAEIVLSRPGYSYDLEIPLQDTIANMRTQDSLLNLINGEHEVVYWETFEQEPTKSYHTVIRLALIEKDLLRLQTVDTADNQYPTNVDLYFRRVEDKYSTFLFFELDSVQENSFAEYVVRDLDPTFTVGEDESHLTSSVGAYPQEEQIQLSFNVYTFSQEESDTVYRSRVSIHN